MTRTPLSRSKGQRSRSPARFAHRRVGASGGCSGERRNVLAVGNCCYVAVRSAAQGASVPTGEERGRGISRRPPAYSLSTTHSTPRSKNVRYLIFYNLKKPEPAFVIFWKAILKLKVPDSLDIYHFPHQTSRLITSLCSFSWQRKYHTTCRSINKTVF